MNGQALLQMVFGTTAASVVICAAALVLRRAAPAYRNALWRGALLAFWAVPALVFATADIRSGPWVMAVPVLPAREAERYIASPRSQPAALTTSSPAAVGPTTGARAEATAHLPRAPVSALQLLLTIWASGTVIAALAVARDALSVRRLAREASPVTDRELQVRIIGWSARLGLRIPPPVLVTSRADVPMVVGLLTPALVLPSHPSRKDRDQDPVIVHELAHVGRGDPAIRGLACLTLVVWWWHPLAWLVSRGLWESAEEACDDWVIAATGDRQRYATAVVRWAEASRSVGALKCARTGSGLCRRVQRILDARARPVVAISLRGRAVVSLLATVAVAAGICLRLGQPAPPAYSADPVAGKLGQAVANRDLTRVGELLAAPKTDPDRSSLTALHRAAREGRADVVRLLLEEGADPNAPDDSGVTPLHAAARGHDWDQEATGAARGEIAELLLNKGANLSATTWDGRAPLHAAASEGSAQVARVLIAHGAELNRKEVWGFTPLMAAAWEDQLELVDLLLAAGARTNLGVSAMVGDVEAVLRTLEGGTRVDARYACHVTLLHFAAHNGHTDLARLLLERGANIEAKDLSMIAARPLHWAVHGNHVATAKLLIERGANVNALAADGYPLQTAAKRGYTEIARMLLENRADPELKGIWETALLQAAQFGRTETVDVLLKHGADMAARDPQGRTALHLARYHTEAARALIDHGADLNARDEQGRTPLSGIDPQTANQLRQYAAASRRGRAPDD